MNFFNKRLWIGKKHAVFKETIVPNKGILLKVARAYCPNDEDRQDLLQEMMIQV